MLKEIVKIFYAKNLFFNNGIVNLYRFLESKNFDIAMKLSNNRLELKFEKERSDEIYFEILYAFFKEYKIVYQTENDRWYFDQKRHDFILDKRFNTKGGQKNDLRNGVYLYKNIEELGLTREEAEKLYLDFCKRFDLKPEKEDNGTLKVPNKKNELIVAITLDEAIERFTKYFVGGELLSIDSKIHTFEDGQSSFHDMLSQPKSYKIDKWDALIYWFGSRIQRFYNYSYFIYPNSTNLMALNKFKTFLEIYEEKIQYRDEKGKIISTNSNIDFFKTLSKDGIVNKNFYISSNKEEFELKFFIYLFSTIYHIEEQYIKANEKRRARKKELYESLMYITFVIYTDDRTFKTSFDEYTKAYKLIRFFEILKESELFIDFANLFLSFHYSQGSKEVNQNFQHWCYGFLNFLNLRKWYYLSSFKILKSDSIGFGKNLFAIEHLYLKHILGGKDLNIHKKAKKVGDEIGRFCAELGDKDLLFKLRNVKNYKQMIAYFKDLKFTALKNENEAKFSYEFNDSLDEILQNIESNWEIVRDYIVIYAIDKYRSVNYAKSKKGE